MDKIGVGGECFVVFEGPHLEKVHETQTHRQCQQESIASSANTQHFHLEILECNSACATLAWFRWRSMNWSVMRINTHMWIMSYVNNMASDQVKIYHFICLPFSSKSCSKKANLTWMWILWNESCSHQWPYWNTAYWWCGEAKWETSAIDNHTFFFITFQCNQCSYLYYSTEITSRKLTSFPFTTNFMHLLTQGRNVTGQLLTWRS